MTEKEIFIENLKKRTKKFAVDVIIFAIHLKKLKPHLLLYQLIKPVTS